jgi:hypothetical protein
MNRQRRTVRRLVRPAAPAPPPPVPRRLQCVCGRGIDVLPEHHGRRSPCAGCQRTFEVLFAKDAATGSEIVSLAYLDEMPMTAPDATSIETSTSLQAQGKTPPTHPGALTDAGFSVSEPDPPDEAQFRCTCGTVLAIGKALYDKRVRCPACGGRHLVTLAYEVETGSFTLHTFSLADRSSGSTRTATRVS